MTTEAGRSGITSSGFACSHVGDSPGHSWFSTTLEATGSGQGRDWIAVIDFDEDVEPYRYRLAPGELHQTDFRLPFEVANRGRIIEWRPRSPG